MQQPLTCVEICTGAGGQARGLAMADHIHATYVALKMTIEKLSKGDSKDRFRFLN